MKRTEALALAMMMLPLDGVLQRVDELLLEGVLQLGGGTSAG